MKNFIKKLCPLFLGPVLLTGIAQSILASDERTDLMIGCDEYNLFPMPESSIILDSGHRI